MRAVFVIYIAAGVTLLFAVVGTLADVGHAYATHHAMAALSPTGDDLDKLRAVRKRALNSAAESFVLAWLQGAILVSARKLNRQRGSV
jgi:hypothetical protein